jgi:hypothetical protein
VEEGGSEIAELGAAGIGMASEVLSSMPIGPTPDWFTEPDSANCADVAAKCYPRQCSPFLSTPTFRKHQAAKHMKKTITRRQALQLVAGSAVGAIAASSTPSARADLGGLLLAAGPDAASAKSTSAERNSRDMNLKQVMQRGGQNLLDCCNPARNYLPYFNVPDPGAAASDHAWNHNIGRWLDALLRLEETIGWKVPPEREKAMVENLKKFCENPDCLPFGPRDGWKGVQPDFYLHSLREYILAVNSLVRYRKSAWAAELGHRMLETIRRAAKPDGRWILTEFDTYVNFAAKGRKLADKNQGYDPHATSDRLIEALVWFYQTTGDPLALELADRFARYHLTNSTHPDGTLNVASLEWSSTGHTHSYLGGQRGLFLFGELTGQHEYIDAVLATYRVTVRRIVRESGYACHDLEQVPGKVTNVPECASTGDAAQLAMWLAIRRGYTELLDDAERWLRARIVPGQLTEKQATDAKGTVDKRMLGGWGASREAQGCQMSYPDVTAAVLHTLCDVYRHIAVRSDTGLRVYFHFNYEDTNVHIISQRTDEAKVTVVPKEPINVLIRVPRWTPKESVSVTACGKPIPLVMIGDFAFVPRTSLSERPEIVVLYGLPDRTTVDTINGAEFHYQWRGDDVIGVSPNTNVRPFYP